MDAASKKNIRMLRRVVKQAAQVSSFGYTIHNNKVLNNSSNHVDPESTDTSPPPAVAGIGSEVDKASTKSNGTRIDPHDLAIKSKCYLGEAPLNGIKLSYLFDALTDKDQFQELESKSLDEFVEADLKKLLKNLKPDEDPKKYFYADYLKEMHSDSCVGEGGVFIACERKINFLDMMDTLKDHFGKLNPHIHVCIDSITHSMPIVNGVLDQERYENRIKEIGYVVIVMSPWDNIGFFRRTALLFELYVAIKHGGRVEVAMSTVDKKTLIELVETQGMQEIQQALELIDFEKSKSSLPAVQEES